MGAEKTIRMVCPGVLVMLLAGCTDQQSALNTAGEEARSIYILFLTMTAGGAVIWLIVIGLSGRFVQRLPSALPLPQYSSRSVR